MRMLHYSIADTLSSHRTKLHPLLRDGATCLSSTSLSAIQYTATTDYTRYLRRSNILPHLLLGDPNEGLRVYVRDAESSEGVQSV